MFRLPDLWPLSARRPGHRARHVRILLVACVAALAVALPLIVVGKIRQARTEAMVTELNLAALQIERALGYGGMIHHFKNAVLRGATESSYYAAAEEAGARAGAVLDRVEVIGDALGLALDLSNQRAAIEDYTDAIATVRRMHDEGRPIREIDAVVRYDDVPAVRDIALLHRNISAALDGRISILRVLVAILSDLAIVAGLLFVVSGSVQRLMRQRDDLQTFTGIAAHDLRGPLIQMRDLARFLLEDLSGDPPDVVEARRLAEGIATAGSRLDRVVSGTLAYARGSAGRGSGSTDLGVLVREIAQATLPRGARLEVGRDLPTVSITPTEMDIVLRNLIDNAVKHHPHRTPTVRVGYRRGFAGREHVIEVADDGPGIPPERRETLFAAGSTVSGEARGMGLAMVRRLVDGWGGSIRVATAEEGGALFRISWPA